MGNYYVKVFTDDSNEKEWEDINPDEIHHITFKGKWYDEVRYGRWNWVDGVRCSICNYKLKTTGLPSYCPNCGAKMDEVEDE